MSRSAIHPGAVLAEELSEIAVTATELARQLRVGRNKRSALRHHACQNGAIRRLRPTALQFGFGTATAPHIIGEAFKAATGADLASIPYKGGAQAITDMLGDRIHMNLGTPATLMPLIRDGKLKALVVTSANRSPDLPDVPTMAESGLPDLTATFWTGVFAPAGTPDAVIAKIHATINASLNSSEMQAGMTRLGFTSRIVSQQEFAKIVAADLVKWAKWTAIAGVKFQ